MNKNNTNKRTIGTFNIRLGDKILPAVEALKIVANNLQERPRK